MRLVAPLALVSFATVAAAVAMRQPWRPGDDVGYLLGLTGGIMMLALLLYPARKRLPAMRRAGPMKPWFQAHMVLGILGPTLVLFHTGFRVGSLNAAVALGCMVVVSLSGIVGRFAYRNIHHGLYGRRASLKEFEARMIESSRGLAPLLRLAPAIAARLERHKARAFDTSGSWWRRAARFLGLGARTRLAARSCELEMKALVEAVAHERGWNEATKRARIARGRRMLRAYLLSIRRASQFTAYERIFSLWHVLHLPLVWLLVATAAYHVLAVHMY